MKLNLIPKWRDPDLQTYTSHDRQDWLSKNIRFPSRTMKRSLLLVFFFLCLAFPLFVLYWNDRFLTVMTNYKS